MLPILGRDGQSSYFCVILIICCDSGSSWKTKSNAVYLPAIKWCSCYWFAGWHHHETTGLLWLENKQRNYCRRTTHSSLNTKANQHFCIKNNITTLWLTYLVDSIHYATMIGACFKQEKKKKINLQEFRGGGSSERNSRGSGGSRALHGSSQQPCCGNCFGRSKST